MLEVLCRSDLSVGVYSTKICCYVSLRELRGLSLELTSFRNEGGFGWVWGACV